MLTETYIAALLVDEELADLVWEAWEEMYPKFRTGLLGVISCQLRRLSQAG